MLLLLLKTSIAALIFAIGMTAVTADIVYLWRRPVLLVKSVAAMYVLMPAVAVLILKTFLLLLGIGINNELDKSFLEHLYHSKVVTMVLYFNQRTDRRYKISHYLIGYSSYTIRILMITRSRSRKSSFAVRL